MSILSRGIEYPLTRKAVFLPSSLMRLQALRLMYLDCLFVRFFVEAPVFEFFFVSFRPKVARYQYEAFSESDDSGR